MTDMTIKLYKGFEIQTFPEFTTAIVRLGGREACVAHSEADACAWVDHYGANTVRRELNAMRADDPFAHLDDDLNAAAPANHCACCGKELSDPESVARGIGPICADNYGF
jgi:hypothetical protein